MAVGHVETPFGQLMNLNAFKHEALRSMQKFNIVLFVETNGDIFVLKNRYGRDSQQYLGWLLEKNKQLTERYIAAEIFISELAQRKWRFLTALALRRLCQKYLDKVLSKYNF